MPQNDYEIKVKFTNKSAPFFNKQLFLVSLFLLLIIFLLDYQFSKRSAIGETKEVLKESTKIGSFQFYPKQNKLVKKATEISLSRKECELLSIFIANPNQIITREENRHDPILKFYLRSGKSVKKYYRFYKNRSILLLILVGLCNIL